MINPENDGIDHINIYSRGATELGRILSNWHESRITTSLGYFSTIEGLIFYLSSFDNSLRNVIGFLAKTKGPALDRGIRLPEDIFKRLIIEAMEIKASQPKIRDLLIKSELPFKHYYTYYGKVRLTPKWDWQVEEWERIRTKLKSEEK